MMYAIHVNLYAAFILLVIWISLRRHRDLKSMNNIYYLVLLCLVFAVLIVDMFSVLLDGMSGQFIFISMNILSILLYTLGVAIAFVWVLYVTYHIFKNHQKSKKILWVLMIPLILSIIGSIASVFTDVFFIIDDSNQYARGQFFILNFLFTYVYLAYSVYLILRFQKRIPKKDVIPLLLFPLLPVIGSFLQIVFFGTLLIWPMASLSLMIIFIFIQSQMINIDALTELYNRREFSDLIIKTSKKTDFKKPLAGIFLDIDQFKSINDTFGHSEGDVVLKAFAGVLRDSFRREDFIARIGGDEFAVVMEIDQKSDLDESIQKLQKTIDQLNQNKDFKHHLKVSIGSDIYDPKVHRSFEDFIIHIDARMYQHKNR